MWVWVSLIRNCGCNNQQTLMRVQQDPSRLCCASRVLGLVPNTAEPLTPLNSAGISALLLPLPEGVWG